MTIEQIKSFQRANGLPVDGIIGKNTQNALSRQIGNNSTLKTPPPLVSTAPAVVPTIIPASSDIQPIQNSVVPINANTVATPTPAILNNQSPTGLAGTYNDFNKYMGNNYVMADGNSTGGLGSYGSYNGVGLSKDAYNAISDSGGLDGLAKSNSMFDGITAKGFSDTMGGLAAGYGVYNDIQKNKRADEVLNMEKDKVNKQYASNASFNNNVAASGIGQSSRPV